MTTNLQPAPEPKPALLVVDDDPLITDTLAFALGPDFEVHACDSRSHAIDLLRQLEHAPGLALVDLGLPPVPHRPDEGFQLIADLLAPLSDDEQRELLRLLRKLDHSITT